MQDILTTICVGIVLFTVFLFLSKNCKNCELLGCICGLFKGLVGECPPRCAVLDRVLGCLCHSLPQACSSALNRSGDFLCHSLPQACCGVLNRLRDWLCHSPPQDCCTGLRSRGGRSDDTGESGQVTETSFTPVSEHLSLDVSRLSFDHQQSNLNDHPPTYEAVTSQPHRVIPSAPPDENGISDDLHRNNDDVLHNISSQNSSHLSGDTDDGLPTYNAYIESQTPTADALSRHTDHSPPMNSAVINSRATVYGALSRDTGYGLPTNSAVINSRATVFGALSQNTGHSPLTNSAVINDRATVYGALSRDTGYGLPTNSATIESRAPTSGDLSRDTDGPPTYSAVINSQTLTLDALSGDTDEGLPSYSAYINSQATTFDANVTSTPLLEEEDPH